MTEVQTTPAQLHITKQWLRDICPTGLHAGKLPDGQPYLDDTSADKIGNYIKLNGGRVTVEVLNAAVVQLWNALTWYASGPESVNFRGAYAPQPPAPPEPERKPYDGMSDEILRQAGLKRDKDGNVVKMSPLDISTHYELTQRQNHTQDSTPKSPREVLRETARKILKNIAPEYEGPYKDLAEGLVVSLPNGQIDGRRTEELRQVFGRTRDGSVDWKATYEERKKIADLFDRNRNQISARTGRRF